MKNYSILRINGKFNNKMEGDLDDNVTRFSKQNYSENLTDFFESKCTYSDGFSRSFRSFGNEAIELIIDFELLQKQWAKENSLVYSENWMYEIMMAQIKNSMPDIVYIQSSTFSLPGLFKTANPKDNLIKIIKDTFPFIKKVIIYSGYPSTADRIQGADLLFSSPPSILADYKKKGLDPILLYHSFDESILQKMKVEKKYDFTFVGSSRAPESRYWALRQLFEQTDLIAWVTEQKENKDEKTNNFNLKKRARYVIKSASQLLTDQQINVLSGSNNIPFKIKKILKEISIERKFPATLLSELYPERCFSSLVGMDMYNLLHQSKITFNKHADLRMGDVGNIRMFEATGVGTCLLTDTGNNIQDLFEPDKEVVTYSCVDEAIEKTTYLLDHPDEAEQIAKAGQARTLKDHTILNRCQQIDEVIQSKL